MKIQHLAIFLMYFGVYQAEGAVLRKAGLALEEFRTSVGGDPDLAAFVVSPESRTILTAHHLSIETYKDKLLNAFIAFKVHTALSAAGHVPASYSGPHLRLAAEVLAADRDHELAEKNALTARIQPHAAGGEDVAGAIAGGGHFHSNAKYLDHGLAEHAAGEAAGRAAERAIFEATIQRDAPGEDITAVYSRTKYNTDVAAANAAGNAAGQAAKLAQVNAELLTLEAFVRQEETAGRINAAARDAILGDIARVRGAI